MPRLALFDLDGTLTEKDTFLEFIKFTHGKLRFFVGFLLLSPLILLYKFKIIPNWRAKQAVLHYFYKGWGRKKIGKAGQKFAREILPQLILPSAKERLHWHKDQGHRIIIISASCDIWLEGWIEMEGLQLISTQLHFLDEIFSGKFGTPNCHGTEKVNRIKKEVSLENFDFIYAYGNEPSDYPMLELANEKYYRHFAR